MATDNLSARFLSFILMCLSVHSIRRNAEFTLKLERLVGDLAANE